ncbi:hypothetical protein DICVIV_03611 [Dictyocaulus viviparus]|uniref:Uncharacterized protein n=1 Tax=Dictyocaulus viviparus TaxID=29172 RepID=A0A0D8Y268_DICVI|nr:hypothetical protein DICVIV_03611 [Dictyocaulus viviparus]
MNSKCMVLLRSGMCKHRTDDCDLIMKKNKIRYSITTRTVLIACYIFTLHFSIAYEKLKSSTISISHLKAIEHFTLQHYRNQGQFY